MRESRAAGIRWNEAGRYVGMVNHLRANDPKLEALLEDNQVLMHPMVIGELACGNLPDREYVLDLLQELPQMPVADYEEVLFFIERHRLMGRGIGYVGAHLQAATLLAGYVRLWTHDRRLRVGAGEMNLAH